MKRALAFLFLVMSSAVLAQTTGTVNPNPVPAQPSTNEEVPPGGCMPIGLTASGEMVFPILCREFIERRRGTSVEQTPAGVDVKSAAVEEKPAAPEEKSAAGQTKSLAPENSKPAKKEIETVATPKQVENQPRGSGDCLHFRTYDPASGTYRGYDGVRRSCKYFK